MRQKSYVEIEIFNGDEWDAECGDSVEVWEGQRVVIEHGGKVIASIDEDGNVTYPERENV